MIWLVRLYPSAWRARYGEEFEAVLAGQRATVGMFLDVLAGAVDARLHPQIHVRQTEGGDAMTTEMMKRCAAGGPAPTEQEKLWAGVRIMLSTLVLAAVYLVLTKLYHHAPAVEGLGYTILPAVSLFYLQIAYLRRRTFGTRFVITFGGLAAVYLIMWGACVVAAGLSRHHGA